LVLSLGVLAFAFFAERFWSLAPCVLCLAQRVPYAVMALATAFGLWRPAVQKQMLWLVLLLVLVGGGIGGYQVGVEQAWWGRSEAEGCAVQEMGAVHDLEALYEGLSGTPMGDCANPSFSFHGVTFAVINLGLSAFLAALLLYGLTRPKAVQT
jgi:disulfide bond formation protein DsbB